MPPAEGLIPEIGKPEVIPPDSNGGDALCSPEGVGEVDGDPPAVAM